MIRKIIEFSVRRSTVTEVVTGVVDTVGVVGLDPVGTEVPIRVPGARCAGVVAVIVEIVGAGMAGATPGRGTLP